MKAYHSLVDRLSRFGKDSPAASKEVPKTKDVATTKPSGAASPSAHPKLAAVQADGLVTLKIPALSTSTTKSSFCSQISVDESSKDSPTPSTSSVTSTDTAAPDTPEGRDTGDSVTLSVSKGCPPQLRRSQWNVGQFELRAQLYNGNISKVYHAIDKHSGVTVALKLYKRYKLTVMERHQVAREIRLHTQLTHGSVIGMYAAWRDRFYVYMALEWAPGGDIYSYMKHNRGRLTEGTIVPLILEPFLSGISSLHDMGLIHRDIKPENILMNHAMQIKIADFGLSIDSSDEIANTRLGTIDYLAPEILECPVKQTPFDNKEDPSIGYTNKVDCWSTGILAYELLCGQPPFASPTPGETLNLIRTKEVTYPSFLSKEAVSFMQLLLVRDPEMRATIAEALEHPWIVRYSRRRQLTDVRVKRSNTGGLSMPLGGAQSTPGHVTPSADAVCTTTGTSTGKSLGAIKANGGGDHTPPNGSTTASTDTLPSNPSANLIPTSRSAKLFSAPVRSASPKPSRMAVKLPALS